MTPAQLIRLFVRHRNAGNLLMVGMLVAGAFALMRLNTQFFPDFGIDWVQVTVEWPGASAEDVEANIVQAIEPEVRFLDGVKRVRATSTEAVGTLFVEFEPGTDMQKALSDVEAAVAQVTTLPEESERPLVRRIIRYDGVSRLLLFGPVPEAALKATAKRLREDLLARGIDRVNLFGARDEEILVEVAPETLRRLDLTLQDIADRIGTASVDMPSGKLESEVVKQVRSLGLATTADALGDIEVRALENGERIRLRDIAHIAESFDDDAPLARHDGLPAIELDVQRAATADALVVADKVDAYVREVTPTLPPNITLKQYDIAAELIQERILLLLRNGASGLILVLAVLFLFLRARIAFWVAAGIPVALFATFAVMLFTGQSINMVSLFALIMALGIVVDDAIVVGEHAQARFEAGMAPLQAAEQGALRMLSPVSAASLTTIAAFLPILIISDIIGQIIRAIPLVIISILIASLIECFLVLPSHLRGSLGGIAAQGGTSRLRRWSEDRFQRFRDGPFQSAVAFAVRQRYLTVCVAVAMLIVTVGLIAGGRIAFVFFPSPESDVIEAEIRFPDGAPRQRTEAMLAELHAALRRAEARLIGDGPQIVVTTVDRVGQSHGRGAEVSVGDHIGGIYVELMPSDARKVRTSALVDAWRQEVRPMPGLERFTLSGVRAGPPGREIDIRLSGGEPAVLKQAAKEVKAVLAGFEGVSDIDDDLPYGKQELTLSVTERGRAYGFTTASVGSQVRHAFEGAIAKRFARGDEEVKVRLRYPRAAVDEAALRTLPLRGAQGHEVPLDEVVAMQERIGFAQIKRENGAREVAIFAEIDEAVTNANQVIEALAAGPLPKIAERYGLTYAFKGKAEEQATTLADMRLGAMIALAGIYLVLAWVFASYARPLVVMAVIPFGLIGAVAGHLAMGYDLTMLSLIALLGLSGILVNDSIILVTSVDSRLREGEAPTEAIVNGSRDRLRAVILTSLTTIGGLLPLMFETSFQAQFLIPIAITMVFGLLVATGLVLIVIPALLAIGEDLRRLRHPAPAPEPPRSTLAAPPQTP